MLNSNHYYIDNLRFLKLKLPSLYATLESEFPSYQVGLEKVEGDNNYIVESNGARCFLHSIYDKEREMDMLFKDIHSGNKVLIIFGVGMGYVFEHLIQKEIKLEHIIIIEPSLQIFKKFLEGKSLEKILKKVENVSFIVNKRHEEAFLYINDLIQNNISRSILLVSSVTYRSLFEEYFANLTANLANSMKDNLTNVATSFAITYLRISNVMHNIKYSAISGETLFDSLKDRPVILVSAGTSLNKNMKYLEEAKDKAVVIGVGTAIQILEKNGIRPHFRAALSPHEDTTIFQDMEDKDVPLIYTDTMYSNILPIYTGPIFRVTTLGDKISHYIFDKSGIECSEIIAELSIANMIFEMLCMVGCKDIILVGQDMAFVDNKMYADGSKENMAISNTDYSNFELVEDVYDGKVYTNHKFMNMKEAILRSINRNPNPSRKVTNCSEGGIKIEGTVFKTLKEQLDDMNEMVGFEEELESIIQSGEEALQDKSAEIEVAIDEIEKDVEEIKNINEERVKKIFAIFKLREKPDSLDKVMKGYEKINGFEQRLLKIPFYDQVVKYELNGLYNAIVTAYRYNGPDRKKQAEAVENILVRTCLEVRKFCNVMKVLIDEYKGREIEIYEYSRKRTPKTKPIDKIPEDLKDTISNIIDKERLDLIKGGKA